MEVGAGTFHPATTLRSLGPKPWKAAYVQPSRRPSDGRYGDNPNRLQHLLSIPSNHKAFNIKYKKLYLNSLSVIGINHKDHDIRFVEDDWESPTLGAAGLVGRYGAMEWKLLNSHIFNKWQDLNVNQFL